MQATIKTKFLFGFIISLVLQCLNASAQSSSNYAVEVYKRTHAYQLKYDANKVPFIEITFANPFSMPIHMLTVMYRYQATDTLRKGQQKIIADIPPRTNFEKCKLYFSKEELPLVLNSKDFKLTEVDVFQLIYNNGALLNEPHQLFEIKK